jgi:hypothetical protein
VTEAKRGADPLQVAWGRHRSRLAEIGGVDFVEVEGELGQAADRCPGLSVFK